MHSHWADTIEGLSHHSIRIINFYRSFIQSAGFVQSHFNRLCSHSIQLTTLKRGMMGFERRKENCMGIARVKNVYPSPEINTTRSTTKIVSWPIVKERIERRFLLNISFHIGIESILATNQIKTRPRFWAFRTIIFSPLHPESESN